MKNYKSILALSLLAGILIAACQSTNDADIVVPTQIPLESNVIESTSTPLALATAHSTEVAIEPTITPSSIATEIPTEVVIEPTATPSFTATLLPTDTAIEPSLTPSFTPTTVPTEIAIESTSTPTEEVATEIPTIEIVAQQPTETPTATNTPSNTPTATQTASDAPSDTPTAPPTSTETPSSTPTPTEIVVAISDELVAGVTAQALNIRNGPDDSFDVVAHLEQGDIVPVLGTDDGRDWVLIEYSPGLSGWVASSFVELNAPISTAPNAQPTPLPDFIRLEGMEHIWQQFNNCAPTAVTMALTYYGGVSDQTVAMEHLRPTNTRDVSVDIAEMVDYINGQYPGVRSVWRMGGNWTTIRRLLAAGFPVIIETSVQVTGQGAGWAGHNRVLIGYNSENILTYDSYLGHGGGEGYGVAESTLDELWRHMNRNYMVLYPIEREQEVAYIMGEDWIIPSSVEHAHRVALAKMAADPENAFAQYNLGTTFTALGEYDDAAVAYDVAFGIGLPFRIFWYQFGVFEAYYNVGRYNEVVDISRRALNNMGGNGAEELYYWLGMGYAARGQIDDARRQFERAIDFNTNFAPPHDALEQLNRGTFKAPV